jgi:methanogenic corrinoid protein MtbC1
LEGDEELARELAIDALASHLDLKQVMNEGFLKGIQEAGVLYEEGNISFRI